MNSVNRLLIDITSGKDVSDIVIDNLTPEELNELYISLGVDLSRKELDLYLKKEDKNQFNGIDLIKMSNKQVKELFEINETILNNTKIIQNIVKYINILIKQGDDFQG